MIALICPACGNQFTSGWSFSNVTIEGAHGQNIVIPCPACGHQWDITGGGAGTWSTTADGRLEKVAAYLEAQPTKDLELLKSRLSALEKYRDERRAADTLSALGIDPPKGGWFGNQANRNELWQVLSLIASIVLGILAIRYAN